MSDDLLDTAAVAALLGVKAGTVHRYRQADRREAFPPPVRWFGRSPVWTERSVREWAASRPSATQARPSSKKVS